MSQKAWWSRGYFSSYWKNRDSSDKDKEERSGRWWGEDEIEQSVYNDDWDWKSSYRSRYKSSLGYSTSRLSDITSHSTYYSYRPKTSSDIESDRLLIEKAYKFARDLVVVLDFPFKIHIQLTTDDTDFSGFYDISKSRRLFMSTAVLSDSKYVESEKINICSGLAIHEAAHLKFTEIKVLSSFLNKLKNDKLFGDENVDGKHIAFLESIINIIEDERVEDKLLTERPGYTDFIDSAKSWSYRNYIEMTKSKSGKIESFLNNLFRLIRYPEGLDDEILEEFSEQYSRIQEYLSPLPESTKEACLVGFKIYKEILNIFEDLKLNEKEINSVISKIDCAISTVYSECLYGLDEDSGVTPSNGLIHQTIKEELESRGESIIAGLVIGSVEKGIGKDTYFQRVSGNEEIYRYVSRGIRKFIPSIRKLIKNTDKNYTFNVYGCRSGLLDTSKLAEAFQGVPQVYMRQGKVTTNSSTVCVLIDESGSMCGGGRNRKAREAAILLNESLKNLPGVDLYIYGHTADSIFNGSTEIRIYRENGNANPFALSEVDARRENRDGVAIYEVGQRVRKFTKNPVLMFVISDGQPCARNYYGSSSIKDVRNNVTKLEKDGFTVIQVSIDTVSSAHEMFTHVIDLKDEISEFPKLLGKIIKKAVVDDKKTTIT